MADEEAPPAARDDDLADLANLTQGPRPRSPVMALAVIVLAGVLTWHLRADLIYAFSSRMPLDLGDARSLAARGVQLTDNRYATVSGQAERRYALYIEPKGGRDRETLFRLLGAGTRLFVRAGETIDRVSVDEKWTGRLRRFDTLPYQDQLRKYYGEREVLRFLSLPSLKAQLAGGTSPLTDRAGAPLEVKPDDTLLVDVDYAGELKVYLSQEKFPSLADAQHELDKMGVAPSGGSAVQDEFAFVVPLPDAKKDEIIGKLSAREFAFVPRQERYTTTRKALALAGETLTLDGKTSVPFSHVRAIGVPAPVDVDHDAFILVEGDSPADYFWVPLVVGMLIAFAAFNVWYLLRTRRRRDT
jgi:hypothetical protein